MQKYLANRLLSALFVIFGVSAIVFLLTYLSGDPASLMLPAEATRAQIDAFRHAYGFDDPLLVQYGRFLGGAVRGDFGTSIRSGQPALAMAIQRLPKTLELSVFGLCFGVGLGIVLGITAAVKRRSVLAAVASILSVIGQSMPNFWLGILLILVFAVNLHLLPSIGTGSLRHIILPGVTVGVNLLALITRLTRSNMLDILAEDYVRTARSKGLSEKVVLVRHALRNALVPLVTVVGLQFGQLLGGAVIIETVFAWPGIGLLAVQSIYNRDYPVVQACVFLLAVSFVLINLLVDLAYAWLDPRIRLQA